jgi:hypothetical protein
MSSCTIYPCFWISASLSQLVSRWNHEGGLHFRDNRVSKILKIIFSAELIFFSAESTIFRKTLSAEPLNVKSNDTLTMPSISMYNFSRTDIFSSGNVFSAERYSGRNNVSAEISFGEKFFRPKHYFGRNIFRPNKCLYITRTSLLS